MLKINFILDRPELHQSLSPTGDKYPISLFHQYVFHQVDEKGAPVLDLSHVLRSLNKLDVGIDEKILLVSSDEQSCLIVSYREMKDLIGRTFTELLKERK
jgi:PAB-dependent poly(A)-specific ribonuclease subunit 3